MSDAYRLIALTYFRGMTTRRFFKYAFYLVFGTAGFMAVVFGVTVLMIPGRPPPIKDFPYRDALFVTLVGIPAAYASLLILVGVPMYMGGHLREQFCSPAARLVPHFRGRHLAVWFLWVFLAMGLIPFSVWWISGFKTSVLHGVVCWSLWFALCVWSGICAPALLWLGWMAMGLIAKMCIFFTPVHASHLHASHLPSIQWIHVWLFVLAVSWAAIFAFGWRLRALCDDSFEYKFHQILAAVGKRKKSQPGLWMWKPARTNRLREWFLRGVDRKIEAYARQKGAAKIYLRRLGLRSASPIFLTISGIFYLLCAALFSDFFSDGALGFPNFYRLLSYSMILLVPVVTTLEMLIPMKPAFGLYSLWASSRAQFIRETGLACGLNILELWASMLAAILISPPIVAAVTGKTIAPPTLELIAFSLFAQFGIYGISAWVFAINWTLGLRVPVWLTLLGISIVMLHFVWAKDSWLSLTGAEWVGVDAFVLMIGLLFLQTAYRKWREVDLD